MITIKTDDMRCYIFDRGMSHLCEKRDVPILIRQLNVRSAGPLQILPDRSGGLFVHALPVAIPNKGKEEKYIS